VYAWGGVAESSASSRINGAALGGAAAAAGSPPKAESMPLSLAEEEAAVGIGGMPTADRIEGWRSASLRAGIRQPRGGRTGLLQRVQSTA